MTKKFITILVTLIIILAIVFVLFKILKVQNKFLIILYPTKYSEYVEKYSEENDVDKYLVYAIIKAESNFNPDVTSNSDAKGLMQLMEETAIDMSNSLDSQEIDSDDLYDPETNIRLGISYLSYLLNMYNGNTILALTAYNAGLGNVNEWINEGIIKPDGTDVENIPYKETSNYVRKILRDYQIYLELYGK